MPASQVECPISLMAPRVPVITNRGQTYDFVNIAQHMLQEEEKEEEDGPTPNAILDPVAKQAITTLIYNRQVKILNDAIIDEVTPLSIEEKQQIARFYTRLTHRYPELNIHGIHDLEGMQALIAPPTNNLIPRANMAPLPQDNPYYVNTKGQTSLYLAAHTGSIDLVRQLLILDAVDPNQADSSGITPLSIATLHDRLDVVNTLLDNERVNPNQAGSCGITPLLIAASRGRVDVVNTLLANERVNPNQVAVSGTTPLLIATKYGHSPIVNALLADERINPNQASTVGETPLHIAAYEGHLSIVDALLANTRIAPNQVGSTGGTPLSIAVERGHVYVVRALLSHATVRQFLLNQLIENPDASRFDIRRNDTILTALTTYRDEFWDRLQDPASLELSPEAHKALLKAILDSRQAFNNTRIHPLYMLFYTPQHNGWFSWFNRAEPTILDKMQVYMDATYPEPNQSGHKRKFDTI
ncbi:MAG: ankyrin repeat domain-containing protein [Legionellaceae bacterium]|nr:ankyrin repeat domain-containing protein [Legionellaceae bacterium]